MAAPRLKKTNVGKSHVYRLDCACPGRYSKHDPHKLVGVTTALKAKAKDSLIGWAGRITAEYAIDNWDRLAELPPSQRLYELREVQFRTKTSAALRGNQIHRLGERLANREVVDVSDEHRGPVEAYARFLDRWDFETLAAEVPVANTRHRYGGTVDLIGRIHAISSDQLVMLDVKTGKAVYEETALQLAGYGNCDLWQPDGPKSEAPMPPVDAYYVAHVRADTVDLLPVDMDDGAFPQFLYALAMWRDDQATQSDPRIGQPLDPPPLEETHD